MMVLRNSLKERLTYLIEVVDDDLVAQVIGSSCQKVNEGNISLYQIRKLIELDAVVTYACQLWNPNAVRSWLLYPSSQLKNQRPVDVLMKSGSTPVLDALDDKMKHPKD